MIKITNKPMPAGASIAITKVWQDSLLGSAQDSLTDPSEDQPILVISQAALNSFGSDAYEKVNFTVEAELGPINGVANIAIAIAWDPQLHPHAPLIYQSNLKSSGHVTSTYREPFMPKYPYMRRIGQHKLVIAVQLREVSTVYNVKTLANSDCDIATFSEFPGIGDPVTKTVTVIITE